MDFKRIAILSTVVSSLTLASVGAAFADTPKPTTASTRTAEDRADVISRVDHRIQIRLDELNKLVGRLNSDTRLSANDKNLLLGEDQAAITGLTALKAKVDAETTADAVRTDEGQIATFKVMEVLAPQNRELIAVDNLQSTAAKLTTQIASAQTRVTALQGQGVNVTSIQALLTDATTKLAAINALLANDQALLEGMTPASTNTTATFNQVRTDLGTARTDFSGIRSDFKQLRAAVKALKPAPTPTATP
jgi:hypothetical protein